MKPRSPIVVAALVAAAAALPGAATAEDWSWRLTPYAWATTTTVDVAINDRVFGGELAFGDLIDDADFAGMIHVEAQKEKLGVFFDVLAGDFGDEPRSIGLGPLQIAAQSDLELTILEAGGIYNLNGDGSGLSLYFGGRVIDADQEIDLDLPELLGGERRVVDASATSYDGMLGVRGTSRFGDGWSFSIWGDVASGSTDFTWNAAALFGYRFGEDDDYVLHFGYRIMQIELDEDDELAEVETEIEFAGPLVGFSWLF